LTRISQIGLPRILADCSNPNGVFGNHEDLALLEPRRNCNEVVSTPQNATDRGEQVVRPDRRADFDPATDDYAVWTAADEPDIRFEVNPERLAGQSA
jgi:hypothetical protein